MPADRRGAGATDGSRLTSSGWDLAGIHRLPAPNLEQLEPERLDSREHAVERGLIRQVPEKHRDAFERLGVQLRKRTEQPFAELAADVDLVP